MRQLQTDEPRKRTQIQLPESLYRELEERAKKSGCSMNMLITLMLTKQIENPA